MVFHPRAGAAYVINELDSTLTVCGDADGKLQVVQTASTRPADSPGENFPAELWISADGRYLYGSSRGDNTIAVFATAADGLSVELVQTIGFGGDWPRHLAFSNECTGCTPPTSAPTRSPSSRSPTAASTQEGDPSAGRTGLHLPGVRHQAPARGRGPGQLRRASRRRTRA